MHEVKDVCFPIGNRKKEIVFEKMEKEKKKKTLSQTTKTIVRYHGICIIC